MKTKTKLFCLTLSLAMVAVLTGCETTGGAAGTGAGIGAVAGAIIGHQSGHALEGAAIGAAVGAGAGAAAHKIRAKRARSKEETEAAYQYQPQQGEKLIFEQTDVLPGTARPGEMVDGSIQYALLGTGAGIEVVESRSLLYGDRLIADISSESIVRTDGTWVSSQEFRVPANSAPGLYKLVTKVRTAKSAISGSATFTVE